MLTIQERQNILNYDNLIEKSKLEAGEFILNLLNSKFLTEYQCEKLTEIIRENEEKLDTFYSPQNLKALDKSIAEFESGKIKEHKLIEEN